MAYENENYDPDLYKKPEKNSYQRSKPVYHHAVRQELSDLEMEKRRSFLKSKEFLDAYEKNVKLFGEEVANGILRRCAHNWTTHEVTPAKQEWK